MTATDKSDLFSFDGECVVRNRMSLGRTERGVLLRETRTQYVVSVGGKEVRYHKDYLCEVGTLHRLTSRSNLVTLARGVPTLLKAEAASAASAEHPAPVTREEIREAASRLGLDN